MGPNLPSPVRVEPAWAFAILITAGLLGGLLTGFEPNGFDPDRMYRPLKAELARSLRAGQLPFWSDRFGVGVPLVAESHLAAFYPPNLLAYRFLQVATAYRLLMWLHGVALSAATYAYGRRLGLSSWGSALASLVFTFCGFQAIHAAHEPFYNLMPYLPVALLLAEIYLGSGRLLWAAALAIVIGAQWTLGHFQIQMWTNGLVVFTGLRRVIAERRPWSRLLVLVVALAWGGAIAAVQLGLSWDLARSVGQTARSFQDLAYYSYPPSHWFEPALPWFFRGLPFGGDDPYFHSLGTSGLEATFYVGTIPLILAFVGLVGSQRPGGTGPWKFLIPLSFGLATLPRWWPAGYAILLQIPGLGYFRAPARYTLLTSLGLALLAGQGFDQTVSSRRFRTGFALAIAFGLAAIGWGLLLAAKRPVLWSNPIAGLPFGVATALPTWAVSLAVLAIWRSGKVGGWLPILVTVAELGSLYFLGPISWGRPIRLPGESPVLSEIAASPSVRRVGGVLDNLPVSAGLATGSPYLGMSLAPMNRFLREIQDRRAPHGPAAALWLRRLGVSQTVWDEPVWFGTGVEQEPGRPDQALDRLVDRLPGKPAKRSWRIVQHDPPFPEARVALRAFIAADRHALLDYLSTHEAKNEVWFEAADVGSRDLTHRANSARVIGWDGRTGLVEHDGPCDLVLTRAYDPNWLARLGDGPERSVDRADGGLQSIQIDGSGETRVTVRYAPPRFRVYAVVSILASLAALVVLGSSVASWKGLTGEVHATGS